jgi:hypothetical protein
MRVRVVFTAIAVMAAAPVWAQSTLALSPRAIMPAHVMCADVLVPALPTPARRIAGAHSPEIRLAMNRGDLAVLPRMPEDGYAVGQRYLVQRLPSGERAVMPKAGGYVPIRTVGWLTVTAVDDSNAMGLVDYACDAIEPDDFLVAYVEPALPTPDPAMPAPDFTERVQILPGENGRHMFGAGDMFSIARGTDDGVMVGARYAIYRDRKDGKPLVHIGEAVAADPSASTAKLILTRMLNDSVEITDIAVPRRQN